MTLRYRGYIQTTKSTMIKQPCSVTLNVRRLAAYLRIDGDVDGTIPLDPRFLFRASLTQRQVAVIDLSDAQSLDSAGLAWIERLAALGETRGVRCRIVARPGTRVRKVLDLMKFDRFLVLSDSVFDALRFGRMAARH